MAPLNFSNLKHISLKIIDKQVCKDIILLRHSKTYCWTQKTNKKFEFAFSDLEDKNYSFWSN